MSVLTYEKFMRRFRHMMTESHVVPANVTDASLLEILKPENHEEKLAAMKSITSLLPESYWNEKGL